MNRRRPWSTIAIGRCWRRLSKRRPRSCRRARGLYSLCTTWKGTRTRKSHESSASRRAAPNHSSSRRERNSGACSRTLWKVFRPEPRENMQHLPIERLAELGDVEPTRDEAEHLALCAQCARERAAYRRLTGLAGDERSRIGPPLSDWTALRSRLSHDGLIQREDVDWNRKALGTARRLRQVAAAVLLVIGGAYAGRMSAGLSSTQALALRQYT